MREEGTEGRELLYTYGRLWVEASCVDYLKRLWERPFWNPTGKCPLMKREAW